MNEVLRIGRGQRAGEHRGIPYRLYNPKIGVWRGIIDGHIITAPARTKQRAKDATLLLIDDLIESITERRMKRDGNRTAGS